MGYSGGGVVGSTIVRKGKRLSHDFAAFAMPDIQREPEVGDTWARFVQTAGGRTGVPAPRRVRRPPFVQWRAPLAWTTLALTLHTDGRVEWKVVGASRFPTALDLWTRRLPRREDRHGQFQVLVPARLWQGNPVGRGGLARARDRRRDRAGAHALDRAHAWCWRAGDQGHQGGYRVCCARANPATN